MIAALITGTLLNDPVVRQAANGTAFATATLRVAAGADAIFVGVAVFTEAGVDRMRKLAKGGAMSAAGTLEQTEWTAKDGSARTGWRLTASEIMTVYAATKRRGQADDDGGAK